MIALYVALTAAANGNGVEGYIYESNAQGAAPLSYDVLTPAAFSRMEKVLFAHDTETCDRCETKIGVHLDASTDPETEQITDFFVTGDGLALCEEDAEALA